MRRFIVIAGKYRAIYLSGMTAARTVIGVMTEAMHVMMNRERTDRATMRQAETPGNPA